MLNIVRALFCIFLLPLGVSYATTFPKGCEEVGFQFEDLQLTLNQLGEQTIYFIQNTQDTIIEIKKVAKSEGLFDMGWRATLNPHHWASLATDTHNMRFKCQTLTKGKAKQVACKDIIRLCQYHRVQFSLSNQGTYWISRNASLRYSKSSAIKKGILLRW